MSLFSSMPPQRGPIAPAPTGPHRSAFWPTTTDYNEAIQNLRSSVADEELRGGELTSDRLRLPVRWVGNFAIVYQVACPQTGNTYAVKCFTRQVHDLQDRYRQIAAHLEHAQLPFTVDFKYLDQGVRVHGDWFPILKMRWVEGLGLNQFVEEHLRRPRNLKMLLDLWVKLAGRLRETGMAHADLQHGNVLLVPMGGGALGLRLIDYDGMYVPSLAGMRSDEVGHAAYQHPQRLREGIYSPEVDRFSHLVIYTGIRCLIGRQSKLWQQFNDGDNLLFRQSDFIRPAESKVFHTLWRHRDADARAMVGRLILACRQPLVEVPLLDEVVSNGRVKPLPPAEERAVEEILSEGKKGAVATLSEWTPTGDSSEDRFGSLDESAFYGIATLLGTQPAAMAGTAPTPPPPPDQPHVPDTALDGVQSLDEIALQWLTPPAAETRRQAPLVRPHGLLALTRFHTDKPPQATEGRPAQTIVPLSVTRRAPPKEKEIVLELGGGVNLKFVLIPAGEFTMGSPNSDDNAVDDEKPQHSVRITKPFYIGKYLVTQEQWQAVMGNNPGHFSGPKNPVETVSWDDCQKFLGKLRARFAGENGRYILPTEAQWEYACRAASTTRYCFGDDENQLGEYAWYGGELGSKTRPVGQKEPNTWGLYDMHGNVWEWCQDWYGSEHYRKSYDRGRTMDDPAGPAMGLCRVCRGGGWAYAAAYCRSAFRFYFRPGLRINSLGLRVCAIPGE
jgi:formylglycine-generating enzyme required for sulfatase activity